VLSFYLTLDLDRNVWVHVGSKFSYGFLLFVCFFGARLHDHDLVFLGKRFLVNFIKMFLKKYLHYIEKASIERRRKCNNGRVIERPCKFEYNVN
jgi:hypothetical protein